MLDVRYLDKLKQDKKKERDGNGKKEQEQQASYGEYIYLSMSSEIGWKFRIVTKVMGKIKSELMQEGIAMAQATGQM